jgi:two-component system phosphate regulon response regulator PhoB
VGQVFPVLVIADSKDRGMTGDLLNQDLIHFLPKPFDRGLLVSRVHSFVTQSVSEPEQIYSGGLKLCSLSFDVHLNGARVHLTQSEFKLLKELLSRPDEVLNRDFLIQKVQGEGVVVVDRAIDTHVFSLRKKLGRVGESIETIRGEGYRFCSQGKTV